MHALLDVEIGGKTLRDARATAEAAGVMGIDDRRLSISGADAPTASRYHVRASEAGLGDGPLHGFALDIHVVDTAVLKQSGNCFKFVSVLDECHAKIV